MPLKDELVLKVRNKSQKYYSLARSPLRLPGSADIISYIILYYIRSYYIILYHIKLELIKLKLYIYILDYNFFHGLPVDHFLAPSRRFSPCARPNVTLGNREAVQLVMQRRSVCFAQIWTSEHGKIQGMSQIPIGWWMKKEGFGEPPLTTGK